METALVVAIIAAAASLVSALVSGRSARSSRLSASHALSINHQLASIDRDADEIRDAFGAVMEKLGTYRASLSDTGALMSALEALMACRAVSEELEACAHQFQMNIASQTMDEGAVTIKDVRKAYTACQADLRAMRDSILESQMGRGQRRVG